MTRSSEIFEYLDRHGVRDKDAATSLARRNRPVASRMRIEKMRGGQRTVIDLHGLTEDEASREIRTTVARCESCGIKRMLIIHGQGRHCDAEHKPVLGRLARAMLENELRLSVRDFRTAAPCDGGEGATDVWLA